MFIYLHFIRFSYYWCYYCQSSSKKTFCCFFCPLPPERWEVHTAVALEANLDPPGSPNCVCLRVVPASISNLWPEQRPPGTRFDWCKVYMSRRYAEKAAGLSLDSDVAPQNEWLCLGNVPGDQSSLSNEDRPESFLISPGISAGPQCGEGPGRPVGYADFTSQPPLRPQGQSAGDSGSVLWLDLTAAQGPPLYTHFLRHSSCPLHQSFSLPQTPTYSKETTVSFWAPQQTQADF